MFASHKLKHRFVVIDQEDYVGGDDIGILDCGHEFHTSCIKQWLILKNICPICKNTALET